MHILMFYLLEFLIYSLLLLEKFKKDKIFIVAVITLSLIPLICFGFYNDFCMRVSIPSLCILYFYIIRYINDNGKYKNLLMILLLIGSLTGVFEISRGLQNFGIKSDDWVSVPMAQNKSESEQYISHIYKDINFYKFFMKK
jgi:hypothetical protein